MHDRFCLFVPVYNCLSGVQGLHSDPKRTDYPQEDTASFPKSAKSCDGRGTMDREGNERVDRERER